MKPLEYIAIPVASRDDLATHMKTDLGIALLLALYCGHKVNGGVIENCRHWSAEAWAVRVGCAAPTQDDMPGLWHWEGDNLNVELYEKRYEQKALSLRNRANNAILQRWKAGGDTTQNTSCISKYNTSSNTSKVKISKDNNKKHHMIRNGVNNKDDYNTYERN